MTDAEKIEKLRTALLVMLDACDYTAGACQPTEMVGAVLDKTVIRMARKAAEDTAT